MLRTRFFMSNASNTEKGISVSSGGYYLLIGIYKKGPTLFGFSSLNYTRKTELLSSVLLHLPYRHVKVANGSYGKGANGP